MTREADQTLFEIPPPGDYGPVEIHPTALVDDKAQLGAGVKIGPFSIIGPKVILEDGVIIGSHCTIENRTSIGERTVIYPYASMGSAPQDLKYAGEDTELIIGSENSIRQYSNFSTGTQGGGGKTEVGRRNIFMVNTHVGHDCIVHNNCILANGASLGGHVTIYDFGRVGGHAAIHQFCKIGTQVMIAGGAMVVQDVPPYCIVHGDRAGPKGINIVGMKRAGYSAQEITDIKVMYKMLYKDGLTVEQCVSKIKEEIAESHCRDVFVDFLSNSERGVVR